MFNIMCHSFAKCYLTIDTFYDNFLRISRIIKKMREPRVSEKYSKGKYLWLYLHEFIYKPDRRYFGENYSIDY